MARPKEIVDGVKMNLFVPGKTKLNARILTSRAKKKGDKKASLARTITPLIEAKAQKEGITDADREKFVAENG